MDPVQAYALSAAVSAMAALGSAGGAAALLFRARRYRSLASRCDGLEAEVSELTSLLKRMDARDRMRAIRASDRAEDSPSSTTPIMRRDAKPDAIADPQAWKTWMRAKYPAIGPHRPPQE